MLHCCGIRVEEGQVQTVGCGKPLHGAVCVGEDLYVDSWYAMPLMIMLHMLLMLSSWLWLRSTGQSTELLALPASSVCIH